MLYVAAFLLGVAIGAVSLFVILIDRESKLRNERKELEEQANRVEKSREAANQRRAELEQEEAHLKVARQELDGRVVSYTELQGENALLKHDLHNIDVDLRKLQLDRALQQESHASLDQRTNELGTRYLKENVKWIGSSLGANNFAASKQRLQTVIERCRRMGFEVAPRREADLLADLKADFEKEVRLAFEREEQARIRTQIREEQRLEKEIKRELKQLDREREAIRVALEKALADTKDEHSEEVERLRARLAEAEEKSKRAISRAQMTKSGHVYVLSNIGSFGENVFKIGMTRRLEPNDRVRELGIASVPFLFDVHMMISADDAPKLENTLHRALRNWRVNKVNPRKEFFKTDLDSIRKIVEQNHGNVEYTAKPEALEYRQGLEMSGEDAEYIESVYNAMSDGIGGDEDEG